MSVFFSFLFTLLFVCSPPLSALLFLDCVFFSGFFLKVNPKGMGCVWGGGAAPPGHLRVVFSFLFFRILGFLPLFGMDSDGSFFLLSFTGIFFFLKIKLGFYWVRELETSRKAAREKLGKMTNKQTKKKNSVTTPVGFRLSQIKRKIRFTKTFPEKSVRKKNRWNRVWTWNKMVDDSKSPLKTNKSKTFFRVPVPPSHPPNFLEWWTGKMRPGSESTVDLIFLLPNWGSDMFF